MTLIGWIYTDLILFVIPASVLHGGIVTPVAEPFVININRHCICKSTKKNAPKEAFFKNYISTLKLAMKIPAGGCYFAGVAVVAQFSAESAFHFGTGVFGNINRKTCSRPSTYCPAGAANAERH